ncbi:MAG: DUF5777 family beta-barrel protein [Balneolaceae bacterium]
MIKIICTAALLILLSEIATAQLPRERVQPDDQVETVFWSTTNIGISTVQNLSARNLNTTIAHTFGTTNRGIEQFFGLDDGANTRLGIDYGISDTFSIGIGRMTFDKVVDLRGKYNLMRQTTSENKPIDLAVKLSTGINTTAGIGLEFSDRLSYLTSFMAARKFNRLSIQLTPMLAFFNDVDGENENRLFGLGILSQFELNERFALGAEYLPVLGDRNPGTEDAIGISLNIDTGGHIFQILFNSSQWHGEQYIMSNNRDQFLDGEFRFGFNIHRVFGL